MTQIASIVQPLESVRRRTRLLASANGLARSVWVCLAGALALGLADYLLHLPSGLRLGGVVAIIAFLIYSLYTRIARPLYRPFDLDVVAAHIEKLDPQLQDRLRSALAFSSTQTPGSQALQDAVVNEAVEAMKSVDLSAVTDSRPLRRSALWLVISAGVAAGLFFWQPSLFRIGIDRLIRPTSSLQWPRIVEIQLARQLPHQIPSGQRLDFAVKLVRGDRADRKVVVSWQLGQGPVQQQLMTRSPDNNFTASIDARLGDDTNLPAIRLWVDAGDDRFGPAVVELIPRLQVKSMGLHIQPPAYCGLAASDANLRLQSVNAPAGSKVALTIGFNKAARKVRIEPVVAGESTALPAIKWDASNAASLVGAWRCDRSLRFRVLAEDDGGYASDSAEEYEIIARPDQLPVLQLENPRRSEDRTAEASVPLEAGVEDDYGIDRLWFEARLLTVADSTSQPASTQPSELDLVTDGKTAISGAIFTPVDGDAGRHRFSVAYPWKLASFPSALLKPGDVIEFQLAVRDTFDLDGQRHQAVKTPPLRITIVSQEQLITRVYDELRQLATQIGELKSRQDRLRNDTTQLKQDTQANKALDAPDQAVAERIADQQTRASAQAREVANRLAAAQNRLKENASPNAELQLAVASAAKSVADAAESAMKPAASQVKQAGDPKQPQESRNSTLDSAAGLQKKASDQLATALEQLGDLGGLQRAVDLVQDLLAKQREVSKQTSDFARENAGKRPEDLKKPDGDKLAELAKKQGDLAGQTDRALEQLRQMAQRQQTSDPSGSQAMKQAAQTGREQSVSQNQRNAGGSISQNQSSQASTAQSSAQAALQAMLQDLKQAQQHKLEELQRKLADIEDQLKTLVRRQAGHNLDNLLLQEPNAAAVMGGELAKLLATKAGRKDIKPAGVSVEQLNGSQQQTHRNTSDLSGEVEKLKGGGEAAGHLNTSAGRMERAIALLKLSRLKEALQPPQTDALVELELAALQVAELRRLAQQQTQKQKQDDLKRRYDEVRAQQSQIGDVTKLLDQALSGEQKKRSDLLRLNQLSADQNKLSDKTKAMGEQLAELGSTVFVSTNDTIVADMGRVGKELAGQKTGRPTQFSQAQIIQKLDAIIRGLTPLPPEDPKYADRASGGSCGGGAAKRKLPPAAELQLLKDLQDMVNAGTKQATADDKQILPELSGQQSGIRDSFEQMLKKSLGDDVKLPDAKQSREKLPEESADPAKAMADDFDKELLGEKPVAADGGNEDIRDIQLLTRRMTRSQVRLGEDRDPGQTTQVVQKKIVLALELLVQQAKAAQRQQASSQQPGKPEQQKPADANSTCPPGSKPGLGGKPGGTTPAGQSVVGTATAPPVTPGDIRETAKEWGGISQRDRQAIIESAGENIVEKYRTLTEEYYKALSVKASQKP